MLNDFNLHHIYWNGRSRPTQHAAADQLLDLINEHNLSFTLPKKKKKTVTWKARNLYSTIALMFMSEFLAEKLEHCKSKPDMNQSSDHEPSLYEAAAQQRRGAGHEGGGRSKR